MEGESGLASAHQGGYQGREWPALSPVLSVYVPEQVLKLAPGITLASFPTNVQSFTNPAYLTTWIGLNPLFHIYRT